MEEQHLISIRLRNDMSRKISEYSEIELKEIENLMNDSARILSAQEALDFGIIDEIKDINVPREARVVVIGNV